MFIHIDTFERMGCEDEVETTNNARHWQSEWFYLRFYLLNVRTSTFSIPCYLWRLRNTHKQYFFIQHIPSLNLHFKSEGREKKWKIATRMANESREIQFKRTFLNIYEWIFGRMRQLKLKCTKYFMCVSFFALRMTRWTF